MTIGNGKLSSQLRLELLMEPIQLNPPNHGQSLRRHKQTGSHNYASARHARTLCNLLIWEIIRDALREIFKYPNEYTRSHFDASQHLKVVLANHLVIAQHHPPGRFVECERGFIRTKIWVHKLWRQGLRDLAKSRKAFLILLNGDIALRRQTTSTKFISLARLQAAPMHGPRIALSNRS